MSTRSCLGTASKKGEHDKKFQLQQKPVSQDTDGCLKITEKFVRGEAVESKGEKEVRGRRKGILGDNID